MVDPTRPDLRESSRTGAPGIASPAWSPQRARSTDSQPPPSSAPDHPVDGASVAHQTLRYVELLRTLDAIGETVDRLNSQLRSLLTQVGCQLAEDRPTRPPG
jgi:hypothetical protein